MSAETDDLGNVKQELPDGSALFVVPHDPNKAADSIQNDLAQKTDTEPREATPSPLGDSSTLDPQDEGGPLRRINDIISPLGSTGLEALAQDRHEVAKSIATRSDEIYRNEFPVIRPRFASKCETCGAEFDQEDLDECTQCGSNDLQTPDPAERREIKSIFESVNKEGQSMRQLGKITEDDHSRLGVLCWIVRWEYQTAEQSVRVNGRDAVDRGEVINKQFQEIVRGDPKRVVPLVDENGRLGNVLYTCPVHRKDGLVKHSNYEEGRRTCEECGCSLREVSYVELSAADGRDIEKYYFEDEVVMHAGHIPQSHGLDGLSPVHLVWLKAAILHWMDVYASEYFNPHSERTPNKFLLVHTPNPDSFEKQLDEAKEDAEENPYKSGIFYNQISPSQNANTEAQVIDVMGDEFLGQSADLRKRYENQIRTVFGVSDVFDSELEDAGGLNNEGKQIEVTDRSIASAQQELKDGAYEELLSILGYEDWQVGFVPPREEDIEEQRQKVKLLREAAEIGLPARMDNGEPVVGDGEAEAPQQGPPLGGQPPPDEGNETPDDLSGSEGLQKLEEAQKHLVWVDDDVVEKKAQDPFWDADDGVPEFVREAIRKALSAGAISEVSTHLPSSVTRTDVKSFFEEKLTQPQGWSINSLVEDYSDRFGVDEDEALGAVRAQTKSVLDKGREIGYREQGDLDERRFKWIGPIDDDKTDASWEVLEKTNPEHGGTPRPLDELKEIVAEARGRHFPDLAGSEWQDSWQDRDTYVEHYD